MEPSGFITSQITPAGNMPASVARSTAASVWPARRSTPPSFARSGNTWPGRRKSCGFEPRSAIARAVAARSNALVPVVISGAKSIETVNAVSSPPFVLTICGIWSSSSRHDATGRHTMPRPCVTMKLRASGVHRSAAMMKSPSFSRSASSTTSRILPSRMSASARSIVAKGSSSSGCTCSFIARPFP